MRSHTDWDDLFLAAALEPDRWPAALDNMASALNASHGQLIGVGAQRGLTFNIVTNFPDEALRHFDEMDGARPSINYRVAAAQREIARGFYDDTVFEKHYDEIRPQLQSRAYDDWCREIDIPFGCQTNLVIDGFGIVGLAILRKQREGRTTSAQRSIFRSASQAARRAVRLQERLEGEQARFMAGAFESIGICAFILDARGRVMANTARAEELLDAGDVQCSQGHLDARARPLGLRFAIEALTAERAGHAHVRVQILPESDRPPVFMEGFRLPSSPWSFGHRPHAVLVANSPRKDRAGVTSFLMALYNLTPAEADIAMRMLEGKHRAVIAADRSVTLQTLNGQIKNLYSKCGFDSERGLMGALSGLLS